MNFYTILTSLYRKWLAGIFIYIAPKKLALYAFELLKSGITGGAKKKEHSAIAPQYLALYINGTVNVNV